MHFAKKVVKVEGHIFFNEFSSQKGAEAKQGTLPIGNRGRCWKEGKTRPK